MTTLLAFGREKAYSRTGQLIELARERHGDDLHVIAPAAQAPWLAKQAYAVGQLIRYRFSRKPVERIYIGFYGYFVLYAARLLYPSVDRYFDAYLSNYEIMADEPEKWYLIGKIPGQIMAALMRLGGLRLLYYWDYWALRFAKQVFIDTQIHKTYLVETFGISPDKVEVLYILPDLANFKPQPMDGTPDKFRVFFHGTNQVIHNAALIVQAAKRLETISTIEFVIAGPYGDIIRQYQPTPNITHHPWIPHDDMPKYINQCHLCLGGHFSPIPRAGRVIAGKTLQYLATNTPTIVQDNPANRELLRADILDFDPENLIFCRVNTPDDLAEAVKTAYEQHQSRTGARHPGI